MNVGRIWLAKIKHVDRITGKVTDLNFDLKTVETKGYDAYVPAELFDEVDAENEVLVNALLKMGTICDEVTTELIKRRKENQDALLQTEKIIKLQPNN